MTRTAEPSVASPSGPARPEPAGSWPRGVVVGLAFLLAASVALRFIATSALWLDEAQTVDIAHRSVSGLLSALRHDGAPPLYYLLLHGWIAVFGTSDIAVRALSGVCSLAALPLLWVLGRRLGLGRSGAGIAALLLATSPFAVRYATETRMYSLVILLTVLAGLAYERVWRSGRPLDIVAAGVVTGAMLLTHYWSLFLFAVAGARALWMAIRRDDRRGWRAVAAMLIGAALFVPWLPSFAYQAAHTGAPWGAPPSLGTVLQSPTAWAGHGLLATGIVLGFLYYALLAVAIAGRPAAGGVLIGRPRRTTPALLVAFVAVTMGLAVAVSAVQRSAYASRYSAVVLAPFLLAIAAAVGVLPARARRPVVGLAAVLGVAVGATYAGQTRTEAAQVAAAIASAAPGDVVVFCPDQLGPAVHRLAPTSGRQVVFPTLGSPAMVDWVDYKARNEAADPAAFTKRVLSLAGSSPVYLIYRDGYPTVGDKCGEIYAALAAARGTPQVLVHDNRHSFEEERLVRFAGR